MHRERLLNFLGEAREAIVVGIELYRSIQQTPDRFVILF
jgi:hypothetical protein